MPVLTNSYDFSGRTVIVTGAGSGIGRSIARAFLGQGANVALAGRRGVALEETARGFPRERALIVPTDVGAREEVDRLVTATVERFGGLDVLVNNAGVYYGGEIDAITEAQWHEMKSVNVDALFHSVRAALPHLEETGGNIVVVSSVSGIRGDWSQSAYNATKGAANVMVHSLSLDLGARGVRVNAVAPAFTLTDMTNELAHTPEQLTPFVNRVPLARVAQPDDLAAPVLFLASQDAAYITGVVLPVDGGTTASTGQPHIA